LNSIAETLRDWCSTASYCCSRLVTTSKPTALQDD